MREIDAENIAELLAQLGWIAPGELLQARLLTGGVSNCVIQVNRDSPRGGSIELASFVVKQARSQLAVDEPWFCSLERLEREVLVLKTCQQLLERQLDEAPFPVGVPGLLANDAEQHVYAMEAAGPGHRTWKEDLLAGRVDPLLATTCGWLLAVLHGGSWEDPQLAESIGDQQFFEALRLQPYYHHVAQRRPELSSQLAELMELSRQPLCLVHGDMSPKNLLVDEHRLVLIDFEVGHFGDPAFDLGFFQTHLILKALRAGSRAEEYWSLVTGFQEEYFTELGKIRPQLALEQLGQRSLLHLGGCLLARVDGMSPVDYLDHALQQAARRIGRDLLCRQIDSWDTVSQQVLTLAHDG